MNYVYEVYKEKSFTKAAENLHVSQPALSAMIRKTEQKVGTPLFDRSTNPIQLTEPGKQYIKTAEKIMDLENDFSYYVDNLRELRTGNLSIGGSFLFSSFVIPPLIEKFYQKYPLLNLNLFEGHSPLLEQKLYRGELDIVIDNTIPDDAVYEKLPIFQEQLLLAVPHDYSCNIRAARYKMTADEVKKGIYKDAHFPSVPLRFFKDETFLAVRSHNDSRERADIICQNAGFKPHYHLQLNQLLTTYHLVAQGIGVAFISDTVVRYFANDDSISYYKIDDENSFRNVYLYYKKNKYLTHCMAEFIHLTESIYYEEKMNL